MSQMSNPGLLSGVLLNMGCAGQKHQSLSPDTASSSFFAFALSHFPTSHYQPINQGPWQTRKRTLALDGAFLYPRKSL